MNEETQADKPGDNIKTRPSRARYDKAHAVLDGKWRRRELKADRMMREVVDVLWDQFGNAPYAWCGFYVLQPDGQALQLGAHRDAPGASPLPMTSLCGRAIQEGRAQRESCEIAVPVFDLKGKAWAALDVSSLQAGAFDEMDQRWLERLVKPFQDVGFKL
jgi:putative methionine-R-sulfoxide reductase with GAF domain